MFRFLHTTIAVLSALAAGLMYYAIMHDWITPLDPQSNLGFVLQYIVIFDTLVCVPLGLWYNAKKDQLVGMLIASHPMLPAIICFYWLGCYRSMIWLAGIAAIAWYFTKHRQQFTNPNEPEL